MTDKEAILSIINCNFDICANVYENRHNLKCINFCNTCIYRDIDKENIEYNEFPCWQHRIADWLLEAIPQFDIFKNSRNNDKKD